MFHEEKQSIPHFLTAQIAVALPKTLCFNPANRYGKNIFQDQGRLENGK